MQPDANTCETIARKATRSTRGTGALLALSLLLGALSLGSPAALASSVTVGEKATPSLENAGMVEAYRTAETQFEKAVDRCLIHDNETGDRSTCVGDAKKKYRAVLVELERKFP